MFGLPCISFLTPRAAISTAALRNTVDVLVPAAAGEVTATPAEGLLVDFFVNNCEVNAEPHGFAVRVHVNGEPVGTLRTWSAFLITNLHPKVVAGPGSTFTLRLALLNPAGEEVQLPQFSNAEYTLSVLSEAEAEEHAAKGPGLSIERSGK